MKSYEEILNKNLSLNELLCTKENHEKNQDKQDNLLIIIDMQKDFMEGGSLAVPNSLNDVSNVNKFIYKNMSKLHDIMVSLDTHSPMQIFHPCFFKDKNGNNPDVFTVITYEDVLSKKYTPISNYDEVLNYLQAINKLNKSLVIWPYHCLLGSSGSALNEDLTKMLSYFSIYNEKNIKILQKGQFQLSEMYGIFKPEYSTDGYVNKEYLDYLKNFKKIFICGEAKSHCVLESLKQITAYYENNSQLLHSIFVLNDCTSSITGCEAETEKEYDRLKNTYGINIVNSQEITL